MTLQEALNGAVRHLQQAGIEGAERDARLLLAHIADIAPDRLTLHLQDEFHDPIGLDIALKRRISHEPVSKIIGKRMFWGRWFRVTQDVLDPRPETETLIAAALDTPRPVRILDLGTGSGAILITLLAEWPRTDGIGTDISDAALAVAAHNITEIGVADAAHLVKSDWFTDIYGRFDLIVSNPPYISDEELDDLAPEVRDYDPEIALTPGGDGLAPYRTIAAQAGQHLTLGGRILVEIGWKQGAAVVELFQQAGFQDIAILPDMNGRDRIISAYWRK